MRKDSLGRVYHKPMGRPPVDWEIRFWEKVDKKGPVVRKDLGHCWVWTAGTQLGYAIFTANCEGRRAVKAHRWIYEHEVGPVPEGLELDHLCRIRNCVNYEKHLEPVTKKENWARSRPYRDSIFVRDAKGRWTRKEDAQV